MAAEVIDVNSNLLASGVLLQKLRKETGRSQRQRAALLSDLSGRALTREYISRWERDIRLPQPYWQAYIAQSFDITVEILQVAVRASKRRRRAEQSTKTLEKGTTDT